MMERIEKIRNNPLFTEKLSELEELEKDRKFCRHGMQHLLDVARISLIIAAEMNISLDKDIIYAAALLHDIEKGSQYKGEGEHDILGAKTAERILAECGYEADEIRMVTEAILGHRKAQDDAGSLAGILYLADKKSRMCFMCQAAGECKWPDARKNMEIEY